MTRPLVVIAHEATRTGSPRVLLELLRYSRPRLDTPLSVRSLAGGPLERELVELSSPTDPADAPAAVLVNGAAAASELATFAASVPAAVYVHEEGDSLRVLDDSAKRQLAGRADVVLCVSENSQRDLVALGVAADRIRLLPPVVVSRPLAGTDALDAARAAIVGPDAGPGVAVVVGCGEAGWRKGADLFIDVARRVGRRGEVAFAWVGGGPRAFGRVLAHDTRLLGLDGRLRWIGEVPDVAPYLAAADVVVFPSREDPQPLVPLEAAMAGTPTAGFAIGGLADLAEDGCALAAAYPDTVELARLTCELLDDAARSAELVGRAVARVAARQSIEVVGDGFLAVLRDLLGSSRAGVAT